MSKKNEIDRPTEQEDAEIKRGIAADPDSYVSSDEQFPRMRRRGGRPRSESPKVQLTILYDADIVDAFKASGDGWQTRMNDALRDWLRDHQPA